ncbi:unnamed protein product [Dracunculus medinensis]|uniref:Transposase n=1 Tax=Dracunculus medinensis TaxID=318479 RepID=A0A0N4U5G2_DRAME|nr:unnamed protein product [Dracunculus medinensis]
MLWHDGIEDRSALQSHFYGPLVYALARWYPSALLTLLKAIPLRKRPQLLIMYVVRGKKCLRINLLYLNPLTNHS